MFVVLDNFSVWDFLLVWIEVILLLLQQVDPELELLFVELFFSVVQQELLAYPTIRVKLQVIGKHALVDSQIDLAASKSQIRSF